MVFQILLITSPILLVIGFLVINYSNNGVGIIMILIGGLAEKMTSYYLYKQACKNPLLNKGFSKWLWFFLLFQVFWIGCVIYYFKFIHNDSSNIEIDRLHKKKEMQKQVYKNELDTNSFFEQL